MSENITLVRAFVKAFNERDLEAILGFFTADAIYHNIPLAPVQGVDAMRPVIRGFLEMSKEVDWVVHRLAETAEGCVLTERTDRFLIRDRWVEIPVMGTFEIDAGQIRAWRDYFDMNQFQSQLPG